MGTLTRTLPVVLSVGSAALIASGCGGSGSTKTVIEKQAPTTAAPAATTSGSPASGTAHHVPRVVGKRLDVAENDLQDAGLRFKEIGGGTLGIVVKSNWTVCSTKPRAGKVTQRPVALIVDRNC